MAPDIPTCPVCVLKPNADLDWVINLHFSLSQEQYLHQVSLEFSTGTKVVRHDISQVIHEVGAPVVLDVGRKGMFNVVPPSRSPSSAMHGDFVVERTLSRFSIPQGITSVEMHFNVCAEPYSDAPSPGLQCTVKKVHLHVVSTPEQANHHTNGNAPNLIVVDSAG